MMPSSLVVASVPDGPVTQTQLMDDLWTLGMRPASVVMVHARVSAIGWVVGGSETIIRSLLGVLGPDGTLMAFAGWEDNPFHLAEWPSSWRAAYETGMPPFDPALSEAKHAHGRLPERIRIWPGARRSADPEANVVAIGSRANWITADHPADAPWGEHSPLARLVETDGQVLMLGAPLNTITLLHHAEAIAATPHKRLVTYRMPVRGHDGTTYWRTTTTIDTSRGAFDYAQIVGRDEDAFAVIGHAALAAGIGTHGRVGQAVTYLFPARALIEFAVHWMEKHFAQDGG